MAVTAMPRNWTHPPSPPWPTRFPVMMSRFHHFPPGWKYFSADDRSFGLLRVSRRVRNAAGFFDGVVATGAYLAARSRGWSGLKAFGYVSGVLVLAASVSIVEYLLAH